VDLWTTHDGGAHWAPTTLPGVEAGADVFDLEAGSGSVHVAVIDSSSTAVRILTSPADRDGWTLSPTKVQIGGGPVPLAQVVTQGATGWVLEVDRVVVGGARLVGDAWQPWPPPCVDAGGSAFLAASTPSALVAVCNEGQWNERPRVVGAYLSGDNGTTFSPAPVLVPLAEASAVASATPGVAVVAGRTEGGADVLVATFDGGATWTTVHTVDGDRSWNDLGFTSATQGVVVEISSAGDTGSLLMTLDAGHTWHQVPIS
jgi:hypothetical protein